MYWEKNAFCEQGAEDLLHVQWNASVKESEKCVGVSNIFQGQVHIHNEKNPNTIYCTTHQNREIKRVLCVKISKHRQQVSN